MSLARFTTPGGYKLDEVISALQKDIRRGNEEQALFWAQEIMGFAKESGKRGWLDYLWKRLELISHEDIGLASPDVQVYVKNCREQFYYWQNHRNSKTMYHCLINAVVKLCRAPAKTRMADHLFSIIFLSDQQYEIPEYALDKHTQRGRKAGADLDHFYDVGAQTDPPETMREYRARARRIDGDKLPRAWMDRAKRSKYQKKRERRNGGPLASGGPQQEGLL